MNLPTIKEKLQEIFPEVGVSTSSLGNSESVFIHASLDKMEDWSYGIYHNSRYAIFCIRDGKVEMISRHYNLPKFRKCSVKDDNALIGKIQAWVGKVA